MKLLPENNKPPPKKPAYTDENGTQLEIEVEEEEKKPLV